MVRPNMFDQNLAHDWKKLLSLSKLWKKCFEVYKCAFNISKTTEEFYESRRNGDSLKLLKILISKLKIQLEDELRLLNGNKKLIMMKGRVEYLCINM